MIDDEKHLNTKVENETNQRDKSKNNSKKLKKIGNYLLGILLYNYS